MSLKFKYVFLLIFILIFSCSKKEKDVSILKEKNLETQMIEIYNEAMEEFEKGDVIFAGKKFNEAELLSTIYLGTKSCFDVSIWSFFTGLLYLLTILSVF